MSKRSVTILWIIAAALAAITLLVKSQNASPETDPSRLQSGDKVLKDLAREQIGSVKIEDAESTVTLQNKDGSWGIVERDHYAIDLSRFNELLNTLTQVTVAQSWKAGPAFNERYGMNPDAQKQENHGYEVSFLTKEGKEMTSLLIGKLTSEQGSGRAPGLGQSGRYVRLSSDPNAVYAVNNEISSLNGDPSYWLDTSFIEVSGIESLRFEPEKALEIEGWSLSRPDAASDFELAQLPEGREMDSTKTNPLKNILSSPQIDDVLALEDAAEKSQKDEERKLTIKTFEGFTYHLTYAPKKSEEGGESESMLLTLTVEGDFPQQREKKEDESKEDAEKAEEAFAKALEAKKEKLAREKAFEGKAYELPAYVFSQIDTSKESLTKEVEKAPEPAPIPERTEAVSEPIMVPPLAPEE